MKRFPLSATLALAGLLLFTGVALGDRHRAQHILSHLVKTWNAHDVAAMQTVWTADGIAIDPAGGFARGRTPVATLLAAGTSRIRVVSRPTERVRRAGVTVVDFDAEITTATGPSIRRVSITMQWGPDLPGGHHRAGRYFISALITDAPVVEWMLRYFPGPRRSSM